MPRSRNGQAGRAAAASRTGARPAVMVRMVRIDAVGFVSMCQRDSKFGRLGSAIYGSEVELNRECVIKICQRKDEVYSGGNRKTWSYMP